MFGCPKKTCPLWHLVMVKDDLVAGQSTRAGFGCLLDVYSDRDSDLALPIDISCL